MSACLCVWSSYVECFLFYESVATEWFYALSLHDALPISRPPGRPRPRAQRPPADRPRRRHDRALGPRRRLLRDRGRRGRDRKSTRLNSSHRTISYAVFCLKKKKKIDNAQFLDKETDVQYG